MPRLSLLVCAWAIDHWSFTENLAINDFYGFWLACLLQISMAFSSAYSFAVSNGIGTQFASAVSQVSITTSQLPVFFVFRPIDTDDSVYQIAAK